MSCEDNTCGIGNTNTPKPGDPDNSIGLSANTVYGGISVSWSFPTVNPHAVAHTILYRNTLNNFDTASELAKVGGSIYYDRLTPENNITYWYWIRIVSVNGTRLEPVGPVSAIAKPVGPQTLESLTGLIDNGVLAQTLKTSIAGITLQGQQLIKEIEDRIAANEELSNLIELVQSGQQESMTYIQEEITQRADADSALVNMLNTIAAAYGDQFAAIFTQLTVLTNADEATASQITQLIVKSGQNAAAIQNESTVRANADSAIASQVSTLTSRVGNAEATLVQESQTRATADSVLASRVTTAESSLFGNVATGQIALSTQITTVNGKVTEIGALYTAKVQVNGLVGGFGIYNNGQIVEAGFDVDRFWIGRTGPDKVKPFIIDNGIVYIDKARIRDADIDTLKIRGNAITIPVSVSRFDTISGTDNWVNVLSTSINLPQGGTILAMCNCAQSSGAGGVGWELSLRINGNEVFNAHGGNPSDSVALSGSMTVGPGTHSIALWQNSNTDSRVINRNLVIQGAMR